jgi:hypothetical protein
LTVKSTPGHTGVSVEAPTSPRRPPGAAPRRHHHKVVLRQGLIEPGDLMSRQLFISCLLLLGIGHPASAPPFKVQITVRAKKSGQPLPCRIHVKDSAGKPQRARDLPFWFDHFVSPGTARLDLDLGKYTAEIERGPEYARVLAVFEVTAEGDLQLEYRMERLVDLAAEGWWSGELHVHRPIETIELLMRSEDLHVAPVITWWNQVNLWDKKQRPLDPLVRFDGNRFYHMMAGEDEREGGALLYFQLNRPLAIATASREYPPPVKFVEDAFRIDDQVWFDIEKPFWWDVPVWLATGKMHSIGLANNHMCRDRMYEDEAWGKPRSLERMPPPLGNGYWTQEIYYHVLNAGLRVPPSAGSASGVLPNPVGYNRVYVHLDRELTYSDWWKGLKDGRSFVTNGPLLRVTANGQFPGHVFQAFAGNPIKLELSANLTTQDPVRFVEIIKNGGVERRVLAEDLANTHSLGMLEFQESGWFLVRAIVEESKTFRFASTAPFYVEIGGTKNRISKASAQFFVDWTRERMARIKLDDPAQRQEVIAYHLLAEKFWQEHVAKANAE